MGGGGEKKLEKRQEYQQIKETRMGKNGTEDIKMENLTETFASAFGNASHLIQLHQITPSTDLAQSMLQKQADPQLWELQAAKLCQLLFLS